MILSKQRVKFVGLWLSCTHEIVDTFLTLIDDTPPPIAFPRSSVSINK